MHKVEDEDTGVSYITCEDPVADIGSELFLKLYIQRL